jgi:hypothetical protein
VDAMKGNYVQRMKIHEIEAELHRLRRAKDKKIEKIGTCGMT